VFLLIAVSWRDNSLAFPCQTQIVQTPSHTLIHQAFLQTEAVLPGNDQTHSAAISAPIESRPSPLEFTNHFDAVPLLKTSAKTYSTAIAFRFTISGK
jgi:hypothetical protein